MILAIDAGNTHIILGCPEQDGSVSHVVRIATDRSETAFGFAARIKQTLELVGVNVSQVEGTILSCVVPPVTRPLCDAVRLLTGKEPMLVGAGIRTGLHIAIDDPGTVASDLVAAAVAAKEEYPLPCVIVDMGTATTLTVVDEKGRYIGGAILPGVGIGLNALADETSLLPRIELAPPKKAISSSTVESMRSGALFGAAGAIDGILERFEEELGCKPASVVCTGGLGSVVCPCCRHKILLDETLLLKGLGYIYRKNKK
ncbi:MAG: type III pantothenate kinase [Clostridia bacterium]|nr:type III pantothenate kinase [Clostridia bacterium]